MNIYTYMYKGVVNTQCLSQIADMKVPMKFTWKPESSLNGARVLLELHHSFSQLKELLGPIRKVTCSQNLKQCVLWKLDIKVTLGWQR